MFLMLKPGWPGTFRRTVNHDEGLSVAYVFTAGEPVDVSPADLDGLAEDLGKALVIPKPGTSKADFAATEAAVADLDAFVAAAADVDLPEPIAVSAPTREDFVASLLEGGIEQSPPEAYVESPPDMLAAVEQLLDDEPAAEAPPAEAAPPADDRRGKRRR